MSRPIVIVHGWSDKSESFEPLARKLSQALPRRVDSINLADYKSRDDEVTYDDIVEAMDRTWRRKKLPRTPEEITGLYVKRKVYFMSRWIRYGGYYPALILRIFRRGRARCEKKAPETAG